MGTSFDRYLRRKNLRRPPFVGVPTAPAVTGPTAFEFADADPKAFDAVTTQRTLSVSSPEVSEYVLAVAPEMFE
jgi:hypothetical protein